MVAHLTSSMSRRIQGFRDARLDSALPVPPNRKNVHSDPPKLCRVGLEVRFKLQRCAWGECAVVQFSLVASTSEPPVNTAGRDVDWNQCPFFNRYGSAKVRSGRDPNLQRTPPVDTLIGAKIHSSTVTVYLELVCLAQQTYRDHRRSRC